MRFEILLLIFRFGLCWIVRSWCAIRPGKRGISEDALW